MSFGKLDGVSEVLGPPQVLLVLDDTDVDGVLFGGICLVHFVLARSVALVLNLHSQISRRLHALVHTPLMMRLPRLSL